MYVMSSMASSQQSIAGGIFQTVAKLCQTLGFGIATAIFNGVKQRPGSLSSYWDPVTQPYAATMWMSMAVSLFSLCLVPFLTLGTQGGKNDGKKAEPVSGSEKDESESGEMKMSAVVENEREAVKTEEAQAEAMVDQALPVKG